MKEKNKGKNSFYFPLLNFHFNQKSLSFWSEEDINGIESISLKQQVTKKSAYFFKKYTDYLLSRKY